VVCKIPLLLHESSRISASIMTGPPVAHAPVHPSIPDSLARIGDDEKIRDPETVEYAIVESANPEDAAALNVTEAESKRIYRRVRVHSLF
jgi:hypothetical protein